MARSDTPSSYSPVEIAGGGAQDVVIKNKLSSRWQKTTFVFLIIMLRVLVICLLFFEGSQGKIRNV